MRKRITSLLLTLVMLLSLVPAMGVTASAADDTYGYGNIKDWSGFKSYLSSPTSRDLTLENDIDYTTGYDDDAIIIKKSQKLDLNGHKIRIDASKRAEFYNLITIRSGEFTLYDSKGGGAIEVEFARDSKGHCIIMISPDSAGAPAKFTMNGGTLTRLNPLKSGAYGNNGCISDNYFVPFKGGERPQITINGGTINCAYDWNNRERNTISGVQYMPTALLLRYSQLTVNGGIFNGIVWTDELSWREGDAEPRILLNGGVFNFPFAVTGLLKNKTQMVINGARFNDGLYVAEGIKLLSYEGNEPAMLIKSGVFDASGQNLKLDIRSVTADGWYTAQGRQKAIKYAMKLFPNSAIKLNGNIYTSENIGSRVKYADTDGYYLNLNLKGPIEVIPNAWGMKSVTLDGKPINYAKDWYGAVEEMDNSTAHTLKFEWYPLASDLVNAGYSYNAKCEHYISGSTAVQHTDTIAADKTSHTVTIEKGVDPKVYSYDLQLNLQKDGSSVGIISNEHIVKLVVSKAPPAPPEPPAPVAHSITVTNGRGTANPTSAMAGETVTVTAKDDTANNMMFTQWYAKTAGVTFADATQKKTTFVMPDCDVEVNPGFQQVSFTNQPTDSWLSAEDDSKVYFAFSQPITSWKLVNENDQTLASGDAADANALVAAKLILQPENTVMTCRVIVTANGQDFTSNAFTLKWYKVPGAPDVTVYPAGGKFVETLSVNLKTPSTYWEIAYTTDGSDPYDKSGTEWLLTPSAKIVDDSTQVPISKDTTIKACLYNYDGPTNMQKFGDIVTCDFTKVELTPPVADPPSGTSFYDSLNVSLSTDIVNAKIMWSDKDLDVDDLGLPGKWKEYEPEKESITLSGSYGMHGFYALTGIRMEHPDGYTYWVHSDKQDYSYPRITYATIADASVTGKVNEEINPVDVSITLSGDVFAEDLTAGTDVSGWFTNRPTGLTAKVKERTNHTKTLVITISGTPTATSAAAISVEMPKNALRYTGTGTAVEQTVLPNSKAVYNIGTDVAHTHDYTGQPYLYLDPGNHYQECTANDGYNIQPHEFTPWTDNGNDTHSRHCTVCKMTDGSTYTETANHNWQWVVDNAATPNAPGKQHEECVDCHVKRSENTEIPMLTSIMVEHLTVAKPVKDAAAAIAATADSSYTVANTEWMAADGTPLAIGGKFQPGTVYTVKITLETAGAGVFSVKSTYNTIEGKTATVSPNLTGDNHADSVILTYTFDATEGSTGGSTGGGGGSGGGGVTTYAITVKDSKNGDVTASHKSAAKGTTVTLTVDPDKGYVLDTLTVLDDKDKEIKLTEKNGKYVFTMPSGKVTVAGRFKVEQPAGKHPFTDIPSGAYYENAVIWAADKGITGGTSATTFAPNGICTRAQAVTFLWRAAGSPAPKSMNSFADVPADAYYAKAVAWAVENGITSGTGGGKFSPDATCTRAQIVTFLYRAAGSPAVSGGSVFSDVKAGAYYADAVTWAANKGITGGIGNGLFGSDNNCTRAQIVTFLYRYVE